MSVFAGHGDITPLQIWDGVVGHAIEGDRTTLAIVELAPNCAIPEHRHENEQLGVCITGSLRFRVADELREVGPGDSWRIPGDMPHEIERVGPKGALVVECFTPARSDWAGLERLDGRPALRWPQ
jgi:quercetin dioxygenase-like cupin family protein